MRTRFIAAFQGLGDEYKAVTLGLFRIMIPALLVIKALEMAGVIKTVAQWIQPLMAWAGLPESVALVWMTTVVTNIYTGLLVFFTLTDLHLTVAQVSTLGGMMLIAHNLAVEGGIAHGAGIRWRFTLLWRVGGSLAYGALLFHFYNQTHMLQAPWQPTWMPQPADPRLTSWLMQQVEGLLAIALIIAGLLILLRALRWLGVEALLQRLLTPALRVLGISRQATSLVLVGLTLGLAFGGGLLMREARQGHIASRDVAAAICFLGLAHSVIEDTLLILTMGADISAALILRLFFALVLTAILARLLRAFPDARLGWILRPL